MAVPPRCACQVLRSRVTFTPGPEQGAFKPAGGASGEVRPGMTTFATPAFRQNMTPAMTYATQNVPFLGPMQLVGADSTPFSINMVNGKGSAVLPFFNLPAWTRGGAITGPNALRPFRNYLRNKQTYVQPMNQLFFEAQPMSVNAPHGVRVDLTPQAIDTQGVTAIGPYIGGGRSFKNWQVVVNVSGAPNTNATVTGQAVARLHHVFG